MAGIQRAMATSLLVLVLALPVHAADYVPGDYHKAFKGGHFQLSLGSTLYSGVPGPNGYLAEVGWVQSRFGLHVGTTLGRYNGYPVRASYNFGFPWLQVGISAGNAFMFDDAAKNAGTTGSSPVPPSLFNPMAGVEGRFLLGAIGLSVGSNVVLFTSPGGKGAAQWQWIPYVMATLRI